MVIPVLLDTPFNSEELQINKYKYKEQKRRRSDKYWQCIHAMFNEAELQYVWDRSDTQLRASSLR